MNQLRKTTGLIFILLVSLWVLPAFADHPDHPFLTRYPESVMATKKSSAFDEYNLVTGVGEGIELNSQKIRGKVTRMRYRNPRNRSVFEIFANYEVALQKAGLEIIFQCEGKRCGPTFTTTNWSQTAGITVKSGVESRYLAGKLTNKDGVQVYIGIMVGKRQHQVHIVEVAAMEEDLVKVDSKALGKGLDQYGFVSVYGIYFDTGKSEIKPESKDTIDAIAQLLKERPSLELFVVGHTDIVGKLDFNMKLSKKRASAIVHALTSQYGVNIKRLSGQGVGPLAPKATNSHENGRAKNRRVELVQK